MLNSNQTNRSSGAPLAPKAFVIWVFHDARPGHLSQLKGLVKRLEHHRLCDTHWVDVSQNRLGIRDLFSVNSRLKDKAKPELVLAAGHSTHMSLLIAGFKYKAFTAVIMKPSLPLCLFNAVICPKHDKLSDSKRVLTTFGPINNVNQDPSNKALTRSLNLILLGGVSKHFLFDEDEILMQVRQLCLQEPDKQWTLSNSPRTPQRINRALENLLFPNLDFYDYASDQLEPLQDMLRQAKLTFITPDSMSMIFEALSAGTQVALLKCAPKKRTRIVDYVETLVNQGFVINSAESPLHHSPKKIPWEADRAAQWLLKSINLATRTRK